MTYTFAGRWDQSIIDTAGNARPNASVRIETIGGALATLYRDRTKAMTVVNPIDYVPPVLGATGLDANGNLTVFADPGEYVVIVSVNGIVVYINEFSINLDSLEDIL